MRKAIASFTIGTLLASFLAVPAAFAGNTPEWAMEGANAYLKAETRDQGYVLANKCEVATMIANSLNLPMGDAEMQRGAEFQDLQGGMAWCQAAAGAVANTGIATGNGNMFGAAGSVSRAVVATMLVRAFQLDAAYQPASLSSERQAEFAGLEWAQEPMALGVAAGIIQGDAEGRLLPTEGASKWAVATMLHRAAGLDAESTPEATEGTTEETTPETTVEPTPEVAPTGGALTVSLSDNSPSLDNLGSEPDGGDDIDGVTIAAFELTAGSDDVRVNAVRLHEIGGNDVFGPIALFDADGMRVSREKDFNNDNEANVSLLNGGLTIAAGSSVELFVRATIASNKGAATAALAIESPDDVSSNASSVSVSSATTALARLAQVNVERFTLKQGGSTPDVSVGDRNVQVARFDMEAGDEDMHLHALTLEQTGDINAESEMSNFRLEIEGEEVAATPYAVDDYVSFLLDTPYEIEEDDTAQARVFADILDGAGDTIIFSIESDLDVVVIDQAVQQPAAVYDVVNDDQLLSTGFTTTTVNVEAGELTLVAHDAEFTEFGKNQSNLVLGYVDIESRSGEQIELQDINLAVTSTGGNIDDAMDVTTFEAVTTNGTFDLSRAGGCTDRTDCTFAASNVDLSISGVQRVFFRVDSSDTGFTEDVTISASLDSMDGSNDTDGFYFKEVNDDTAITDITPTNIAFEDITSKVSSATVRSRAQSATKTAVQGTDDIKAMVFEIEAGEASYLEIDYLTFLGLFDAAGSTVDNGDLASELSSSYIDELRLYHTSVDEANLIQKQGGGELAAGLIEFDLNDFRIEASETMPFVLVVDLADNDDVNAHSIKLAVAKGLIRDMERETVTLKNNDGATIDGTVFDQTKSELSRRQINFAANGTLTAIIDNTDSQASRNLNVLAGSSAIVGSVELTTTNEPLTLEEFSFQLSGVSNTEAQELFSEIRLLDSDKSVLASKSVSGTVIEFTGQDVEFAQGNRNLYIEVVTNQIGFEKEGFQSDTDLTVRFVAEQVRGQSLLSNDYNVLAGDSFTITLADVAVDGGGELELVINGETITADAQAGNEDADATALDTEIDTAIGAALAGVITANHAANEITVTAVVDLKVSGATTGLTLGSLYNNFVDATTSSNQFGIVPVRIADLSFTNTFDDTSVSSILENGENNVLILEVENDTHPTNQTDDASGVDTQLEFVYFDSSIAGGGTIDNIYLERIGVDTDRIESEETDIVAKDGTVKYTFVDIAVANGGELVVEINGVAVTANALGGDEDADAGSMETALEAAKDDADGPLYNAFSVATVGAEVTITATRTLYVSEATNTNVNAVAYTGTTEDKEVFHMASFGSDADRIESGLSAHYLLTATVTKAGNGDNDDSVQFALSDLDTGSVMYKSDTTEGGINDSSIFDLRLSKTRLSAVTLSETKNSLE